MTLGQGWRISVRTMGRASPFQRGAIPAEGEEGVTLKPHSLKVLLPAVGPGFSVLEIEIGFECSGGDRVRRILFSLLQRTARRTARSAILICAAVFDERLRAGDCCASANA